MDRSFLSQPAVIAAAREFVCVRPLSYEDPTENEYLKSLTRTRSGELENSVFAILAPDGKTQLVRAGRSMKGTYAGPEAMAQGLASIAAKYPPKADVTALPGVDSVKLGLIMAAADRQPLIVLRTTPENRSASEAALARAIWSKEFIGRFAVASVGTEELKTTGAKPTSRLVVLQPDQFGVEGTVLAEAADLTDISQTLSRGLSGHRPPEKSTREVQREGWQKGVFYEPKTPVTDPMEVQARERFRKK